MKSVAADQIKRASQNYWGAQAPPAPPHLTENTVDLLTALNTPSF